METAVDLIQSMIDEKELERLCALVGHDWREIRNVDGTPLVRRCMTCKKDQYWSEDDSRWKDALTHWDWLWEGPFYGRAGKKAAV